MQFPQAIRHDCTAVRERPVPHRPHHGIHPGRYLGAIPAPARARSAFHGRRRRARRADHARGRESREIARGVRRRRSQRARRPYLDGFHIAFDNWHSTHSPENTELSQDIFRRLKAAGLVYSKPVEQFFDPVKGMFLADRYLKGECPNCGAKDQYGDACENCSTVYSATALKNPYSTLSGAKPLLKSSEHYFFKLSDPKCRSFMQGLAGNVRPAAVRRWSTRPRNGWTGPATRRSRTGTSRAIRRISASASPTSRKRSTSTSGSTRRSAIWHR